MNIRDGEASINLTGADIDQILEELMKGYLAGRMDNITYYELHGKLFQGYFQIAHAEARRQIEDEGRSWRRKK